MNPLDELRRLCLGLPETSERLSHGEQTWFVSGKKVFVTYADHHHDDRLGFWCAAPAGFQERLVADRPDRFFRPPYVGPRGGGSGSTSMSLSRGTRLLTSWRRHTDR